MVFLHPRKLLLLLQNNSEESFIKKTLINFQIFSMEKISDYVMLETFLLSGQVKLDVIYFFSLLARRRYLSRMVLAGKDPN